MTTWLSLFPNTTDNDNLLDIAQVIGYAKVGSVFPGSSAVQVRLNDGNMLDKGETYKAVVSAVPLQPLGVSFEGDEAALQPIRDALKTAGVGGAPSMFVSESSEQFDLRLIVKEDAYRIQSADDAYNLVIDTDLDSAESPQLVVTRLEHIARWQTMLNLQNSSSRLPDDAVSLVVESRDTDANSDKTPDLKLNYLQDSRGHWQKPQIRIRVTNHSDQKLYCSIVALSKAYGIMPVRSDWVEPGDSFERTGRSSVPDAYRGAGFTTTQDVYKLFVSTDELDMTLAGQDELPAELVNARSSVSVPLNRLDALLPQFGTRMFEADDEDELPLRDWLSKTVTVTTSRPQLGRSLNPDEAGKAQRLNSVVSVMAHSGMRAKARLSTLEAATRDLQSSRRGVIPPIFREDGVAAHPLDLMGEMASRSGRSELNVLELYDIENQAAVTAENPLEIHIDGAFSAGDALLPLSYDDEFYLPLGLTEVTETGCVVRLHRLPEPLAEATRSVTGSIRILFQKLLSNYIAIEYNYPRLAIAKLSAETDTVRYESNEILVQQAVAEASNVLLYVHGIFDDTGLLASSTSAEIAEAFDLILTFDYENLDSSIRRNGKELFDKLQGVGFNAEDGKDLTIVAHSMGGLVSRSMIEQWGGNQFVSHLMTLGTPHEGSPWAKIEDLALVTLTTVLNGMTDIPWPLRAVLSLVQAIEKFDTNLDDMQVGSNFLEELNASLDPNVRYTIISGDTSLIPNALADADPKPSRFRRMLNALKSRRLQHQLATLVGFFGEANDIAVSVSSARALPTGREPQPKILEPLADDHMSFFRSETGLKAIADNLLKND
ncbi:MAG: esterase/lipase family protein, partial [Candidatus Promineifilaceae bacterium]